MSALQKNKQIISNSLSLLIYSTIECCHAIEYNNTLRLYRIKKIGYS